jgi:2-polyprenyl-6-methoxyphenol hydroxylase-like FAD-dependent oxidoreductase
VSAGGQNGAGRALVIGAGPGGLAAAITLTRVGVPVTVFERSPELKPLGVGLGVQSNALRALQRIGVGQALIERGNRLQWSELHTSDGKLMSRLPIGAAADQFGTPTLSVLRGDLQEALLEALPDGVLRLGAECVGVDQDADGVVARFADGSEEHGAVLIGADGGRSVVRQAIAPGTEPRYTGFTTWRAATKPIDLLRHDTSYAFMGRGQMFVTFPCAPATVYWGTIIRSEPDGKDEPGTVKAKVDGLLRHFPEAPRKLVQGTPEEDVNRTDLYDLDLLSSWVKGRIVLLGDAAHQMTPFTGQGAGIAMEEAIVLGRELGLTNGLRDDRMIAAALESYEAKRLERGNAIAKKARQRCKTMNLANPVAVIVRNAALRFSPKKGQIRRYADSISYDI